MRKARGFTMVEVVIVVALVGIVAAVVIPLLQRAMIAANEAETLADIRTLIDAQTAYAAANGGFYDGNLGCLTLPAACIPSYPTNGPTFLDSKLASLQPKGGYGRMFTSGTWVGPGPNTSSSSIEQYRYDATPMARWITGIRGFAGQADGRVCFTPDGTLVPPGQGAGRLPANCTDVP